MVRDTSLMTFYDIKSSLGERQQTVYNAIEYLGCPTNSELGKHLRLTINNITPRVKELRDKGLVTECEKRECSVTGRKVWSWRLVTPEDNGQKTL